MKNAILVAVIAVGIGGFVSSSVAQGVKQLRTHPDAAADQTLQQGNVELPSAEAGGHPGGATSTRSQPKTGLASSSGETSTVISKSPPSKKK